MIAFFSIIDDLPKGTMLWVHVSDWGYGNNFLGPMKYKTPCFIFLDIIGHCLFVYHRFGSFESIFKLNIFVSLTKFVD